MSFIRFEKNNIAVKMDYNDVQFINESLSLFTMYLNDKLDFNIWDIFSAEKGVITINPKKPNYREFVKLSYDNMFDPKFNLGVIECEESLIDFIFIAHQRKKEIMLEQEKTSCSLENFRYKEEYKNASNKKFINDCTDVNGKSVNLYKLLNCHNMYNILRRITINGEEYLNNFYEIELKVKPNISFCGIKQIIKFIENPQIYERIKSIEFSECKFKIVIVAGIMNTNIITIINQLKEEAIIFNDENLENNLCSINYKIKSLYEIFTF